MFFLKCFYHKDAFSHNACIIWINKEITFSLELSDSDEDVKEDIDKIDNFDDNTNNNEQNIGLSDGNDDLNEVNDILDEWFAGEGADDGEVKVNRKVGETYLVYKQCQQKTLRCKTKKESCKETRASDKKVKLIQVEENDEAVEDGIEVREVPLKPVIAEDPIPKVKQSLKTDTIHICEVKHTKSLIQERETLQNWSISITELTQSFSLPIRHTCIPRIYMQLFWTCCSSG